MFGTTVKIVREPRGEPDLHAGHYCASNHRRAGRGSSLRSEMTALTVGLAQRWNATS